MGKSRTCLDGKSKIIITDIRDGEDNTIPLPAMASVIKQILEAMTDLGLKATVETTEKEISQH